jgi:uncharacterized membrane protein YdfJ with MMPL/SSD domain
MFTATTSQPLVQSRPRRVISAVIVALIVAAVVIGLFVLTNGSGKTAQPPQPSSSSAAQLRQYPGTGTPRPLRTESAPQAVGQTPGHRP